MKKITILFLSVMTLGLSVTSCSSDDDDDSASIVGKWEYTKEGYSVAGQEDLEDYEHLTQCGRDNIEFLTDGSFKTQFFEIEEEECITQNGNGEYVRDGKKLTIKGTEEDPEESVSEILFIDENTLKIKTDVTFEGQTFSEISVFKKI